jgi:CPA1 family monovalent cation:H+ antiporter
MGLDIEIIAGLLLVAAIVAMLVKRLHLPYTVGLVIAGGVVAFLPLTRGVQLTKQLVFTAFLPPLIFEAAFHMSAKALRRDLPVILTLAVVGVIISAGVSATGMRFVADWPWTSALLFGALIAATDPVSVLATFRELDVRGRLRLMLAAESLFNDGTAAVAFSAILAFAEGAHVGVTHVASAFVITIAGGVVCGGVVAVVMLALAGRTRDHLVEITFTSVAAYGSFLLAEHFHWSGVLATLTAGLLIGNIGPLGPLSERGREAVVSFWEYAVFAVNSLVYLLIGMSEARMHIQDAWRIALLPIALALAGRAISVYLGCAPFWRSRLKVAVPDQHVLVWAGMRGALALALALGLPSHIAHRGHIITAAFAVVAFSVIGQGLTMRAVLTRLGRV